MNKYAFSKNSIPYWNHNTAYYGWILNRLGQRKKILDVGCGNGALAFFLDDKNREIVGIDTDQTCIAHAKERNSSEHVQFQQASFEKYQTDEKYDAIIFVASLHHMDAGHTIEKVKTLLQPNGILLIVGLASPSHLGDYLLEAVRIIPSNIISKVRKMESSEALSLTVSYTLPPMSQIRQLAEALLPGYSIRYGLHFRYLLSWEKKTLPTQK